MRTRTRYTKWLTLHAPSILVYHPCPLYYLRKETGSTEVIPIGWERFWDDPSYPLSRGVKRCEHESVEVEYSQGTIWANFGSWAAMRGEPAYLARLSYGDQINPHGQGRLPEKLDHSNLTRKCLEKLRTQQPECQKFSTFTFVAELGESVAMLANPFGAASAMASYGAKKYGRSRTRKMNMKRLFHETFGRGSNAHLEVAFGWLPFLSDVQRLGTSLANVAEDYTSYLENQAAGPRRFRVSAGSSGTSLYREGRASYSENHKARCIMHCEVSPAPETMGYGAFVANRMGLRPADLLNAAWELVPFSFVADWLLPIGDMLEDITQLPTNFTVVSSQYDHTVEYIITREMGCTRFCDGDVFTPYRRDVGRYYKRDSSPWLSGDAPLLTNSQALLSLSLLLQQLAGRLK